MTRWKLLATLVDGEGQIVIRNDIPRGTGEALAMQFIRDGFRLDPDEIRGGPATFYPPFRIRKIELLEDS